MQKLDPKVIWIFFFRLYINRVIILGIVILWLIYVIEVVEISDNLIKVNLDFQKAIFYFIYSLFFLVICFIIAKLMYDSYFYELTETSFYKEWGFIVKKSINIPYDRIQEVYIYQDVIERIFGLVEIHIRTAATRLEENNADEEVLWAGETKNVLPGLSKENAEKLKYELMQRSYKFKNKAK